jgi:translocation and assembly module TamB
MATNAPDPVPTAPARPQRRAGRWLGATLLVLALLLVALPLGGWMTLRHWPAALPWLLQQVPGLQLQDLQGRLGDGRLQARQLTLQLPAQAGQLQIDGLDLQGLHLTWAPHPGAWFGLGLAQLAADRVVFQSGAPSGQPLLAPADLQLPLALRIDALRIARLQIDALPAIEDLSARLVLGADQGALHRIEGLSLAWQQTRLRADLQIGSLAPLAVQATLQASKAAQAGTATAPALPAWTATLALHGPLTRLQAEAQLRAEPVAAGSTDRRPTQTPAASATASLDARATLLPFAVWPLGDLTLATRRLDLSALADGWPRTALSGSATVQTGGLDQAATVDLSLDNDLPGAWDARRLPIKRLTLLASAKLRQPDALMLERFALVLADQTGAAGQLTGTGRWAADGLALDLQLLDLQPARLHQQAAALLLGGPVQLRLTGLPGPASAAPTSAPAAASAASAAPAASAAEPAPAEPAALPRLAIDATLTGRSLDRSGLPVKLRLVGSGNSRQFSITQAQASAGPARAEVSLEASAEPAGWRLRGQAQLTHFDPRPWWRGTEASAWRLGPHRLEGQADIDLLWRGVPPASAAQPTPALERWLGAADGDAQLSLRNSLLAGVALNASLRLQSRGPTARIDASLDLAGNQLSARGQRAAEPGADQWTLQLQAPALTALAPLGRLVAELAPDSASLWPSRGKLLGDLQISGRWPALRTQAALSAQGLSAPIGALQSATLDWQSGANAEAPLALNLQMNGLTDGAQRLDHLSATLSGSLRDHRLALRADSPAKPPAWAENLLGPAGAGTRLQADGRGRWTTQTAGAERGAGIPPGLWRLSDLQLQLDARDARADSQPWIVAKSLAAELALGPDGTALALTLAPGRVQLLGNAIQWREAGWRAADATSAGGRFTLLAELERFEIAGLLARAQPAIGWGGQLALGAQIDIRGAERFDAEILLERLGGDLSITDELGTTQALGISDLRLALTAHDGLWQLAQGLAGRYIGEMAGAQVLRTTADRRFPPADAPLQGVLQSNVANLGVWGTWVPPGWRLAGKLRTSASFGGTLGAPEVHGEMIGSGLGARNLLQGLNFTDGELALKLSGGSARIERFVIKGGAGQLDLTGEATLGAEPSARLQLNAEHFRLLGRLDRRLVVSGQADLQLDAQRLKLDGGFTVDEGLIDLSQDDAPKLDGDVKVHSAADKASGAVAQRTPPQPPASGPARQTQVALTIDLGQKLRLRGHGVDAALRGKLQVSSVAGQLAVRGQVRAVDGTVAAYGQKLVVERGTVTFDGAMDNPQLDVLAIRPNLDMRVGVQVVGPAQSPRIRLYSEPDLPDYDKLAWLVLGRAPDNLGRSDTALLQSAAMALLAGDGQSPTGALLDTIGLTDLSLRQTEGETRETIVSLGKQLSKDWYVGYERGVNATTGSWQLIYRLAQRFTLRAQSGADNALDVIWSWRW